MAENTEEILDEDKMNNPGKDDEVEADNTADTAEVNEAETDADASVSDAPSEEATDGDAKDEKCGCKKGKKDKKLDALESKNAELEDRVKRQMAEFDNFRKRTAKEKTEAYGDSAAKTIAEILPALDNFDRALDTPCSDENFKKGIEMIFTQLTDIFGKLGVTEIEALGQPFNPNLHNAIKQVESEDGESDVICEVFQKGYKLGDRIIRHSMVAVNA